MSAKPARSRIQRHFFDAFFTSKQSESDDEVFPMKSVVGVVIRIFHVHTQAVADTTWTVAHYLGQKYCNVVIVDDADEVIIPESIKFDTNNQLTVTFNVAITGKVVVAGVA